MNRYKLSKAGIDSNEGIARFGGNREVYQAMLERFAGEPYFSRLRDAVEARDTADAFKAAHALKGMVGNLSMNRLYADLCPLVDELRAGSLEHADRMMEQLEKDYDEIIAALS